MATKKLKPLWEDPYFKKQEQDVANKSIHILSDEEIAAMSDYELGIDSWEGSYDYGFSAPIVEGGKDWMGNARKSPKKNDKGWYLEDDYWTDYQSTGTWRGYSYYATPTLDYRYIEQMANMFAAHHEVTVQIGQDIGIDIEKKILTYNPTLLMFGTKANMIAALLHEIGHLKHSTHRTKIQSPFLAKYQDTAFEVINMFEDFRIDTIMAQSYEGAEDIFKANEPIIESLSKKYQNVAKRLMPEMLSQARIAMFQKMQSTQASKIEQYYNVANPGSALTDEQKKALREILRNIETDEEKAKNQEILDKFKAYEKKVSNHETFFHYLASMTLTGYGKEPKGMPAGLQARIDATKASVERVKQCTTMEQVVAELDVNVFPHIEDLLSEIKNGEKEMQSIVGSAAAKQAMQNALTVIQSSGSSADDKGGREVAQGMRFDGQSNGEGMKSRMGAGSGHSADNIPKDWADGDYTSLKDSVNSAIKELIQKMTFIRRKEETVKWEAHQRRGKINTRSLYKHVTGNHRVFKKKLPNTDTLSSFAFSLVIDVSGSMSGSPLIHTVRGIVILAEVFTKMGIPFEVKTFDNNFRTIKEFDEEFDDKMKRKIGGIVKHSGGGTNLYYLFGKEDKAILKRPEKNKFVVILSDGGVSSGEYNYQKQFTDWAKKNVQPFGVGLACGDEIIKLCLDQGISTREAQQLPTLFAEMLKTMVMKRTKK